MGIKLFYLGIPMAIFVIAVKIVGNVFVDFFLRRAKTQEQKECAKMLNTPRFRPYISKDEKQILKSIDEILYRRFMIFRALQFGMAGLYFVIFITAFAMDVFGNK